MANITGLYDPEAKPQQNPGKLPTGEYVAQIVESDVETKEKGTFLKVVYEIQEGPMKGRRHWHNFTLQHSNQTAQKIGNEQFASLREVTGVYEVRDTQKLHYKPHVIRIDFNPAGSEITGGAKKGQKRQYDEAEIKEWKKLEGGAGNAQQGMSTTQGQTSAPVTSASPSSPPWKRAA